MRKAVTASVVCLASGLALAVLAAAAPVVHRPASLAAGGLLLLGLACAVAAALRPRLPPMPELWTRPRDGERWCSACGRPAPAARACPVCRTPPPASRKSKPS